MQVSYLVQTNHLRAGDPLTDVQWDAIRYHEGWHTVASGKGLEGGEMAFTRTINMARIIWLTRLLDPDGNVVMRYDPERDMRLPGCRHRMTERIAYHLWEAAGKPESDGVEFWLQAEQAIENIPAPAYNGVLPYGKES